MVDIMDVYKSLNISTVTVMKNQEILIVIKLKKYVSMQLKNYHCTTRYVSDQYKTQQMCDKVILENGRALKSFPDCYKNQKCVIKQLIITLMH